MEFLKVFVIYRWRDVKLRAFDNAKHRTYVDLKVRSLFGNDKSSAIGFIVLFVT